MMRPLWSSNGSGKISIRIGTTDLKIAAIALTHQGTLLSSNLRDFDQVPGLRRSKTGCTGESDSRGNRGPLVVQAPRHVIEPRNSWPSRQA